MLRSAVGATVVGVTVVGGGVLMIGASGAHVMTGAVLPLLFLNAALCFAAGWVVLQRRPSFFSIAKKSEP